MVVAGINMDGGVPVIGMELSQVLHFSWSSLKKPSVHEIANIPLVDESIRRSQNLEVNGGESNWPGETMRVMYDPWFANNKVDVFFSSQVHAYERPLKDQSAPVYITIADGGNIEGFAPTSANDYQTPSVEEVIGITIHCKVTFLLLVLHVKTWMARE
ncbi:unnamed protein product [Brassica oleracea var. botrytis]